MEHSISPRKVEYKRDSQINEKPIEKPVGSYD